MRSGPSSRPPTRRLGGRQPEQPASMDHPETERPADEPESAATDQDATAEDLDPQELEDDPAYDPDDPELKRLKGG
jgi:hypothetical protein